MRHHHVILGSLALVLVVAACTREPPSPHRRANGGAQTAGHAADTPEGVEPLAAIRTSESAPPSPERKARARAAILEHVSVPRDRKLVRTTDARLEVGSVETALAALRAMARQAGGYTTDESRTRDEHGRSAGSITCRIPVDRFDSVADALKSIGAVEEIRNSAVDITDEYFDQEVRLSTARQLEARVRALLDRTTNKLSDLLEAERELARVRGEIETMEGRKRLWDNQVALSTLTVAVHEPTPAVVGEGGGIRATLGRSVSDAADNFVRTVAGIVALSGAIIPVLASLAGVFWVLRRLWRWRQQRRQRTAG